MISMGMGANNGCQFLNPTFPQVGTEHLSLNLVSTIYQDIFPARALQQIASP